MMDDLLKKYPELIGMDPKKLDFILEFAGKEKPKNTKDAMPFMIAYMKQAKKMNINFTKPEVKFISELLMQDMSPQEKERVNKVLAMLRN